MSKQLENTLTDPLIQQSNLQRFKNRLEVSLGCKLDGESGVLKDIVREDGSSLGERISALENDNAQFKQDLNGLAEFLETYI